MVPTPGLIAPELPADPRDRTAWDRFWTEFLKGDYLDNAFERNECIANMRMSHYEHRTYLHYLEQFEQRGYQRLLFVGNGLGMLPRLFAHRGMQAVALDFSQVANEYCRRDPDGDRLKFRFFRGVGSFYLQLQSLKEVHLRKALDPVFVPGGSVDYLTEDVFECHFPEAHFDAIVMQNLAEHYESPDRQRLARRLYGWLREGGTLLVESQYLTHQINGIAVEEGIEEDLLTAGFYDTLAEYHRWRMERERWYRSQRNYSYHLDPAYEQEEEKRFAQAQQLGQQKRAEGAKEILFQICR
jgi:2-polyprenyl-3-methyl-5-hydroxy-6-metoxy-1,4-benzoquinol methylase